VPPNYYRDPSFSHYYGSADQIILVVYDADNLDRWEKHRFIIDTVGPSAPGTPDLDASDDTGKSSTDNITKNKTGLTFTWSASSGDSGIGFKSYQWKLDSGGTWTDNGSSTTKTIDVPSDGSYRFYVRAVDLYDNPSSDKYLQFIVDSTAPNPPSLITPGTNTRTKDSTPYFDWSCSDNSGGSGIWKYDLVVENPWNWNVLEKTGLTSSDYTPSSSEALGAGGANYHWRVLSYDVAGNVSSSWSSENRFYVDNPDGSILATLKNPSGVTVAGANTKFYIYSFEPDKVVTGNPGTFTDIPAGATYEVEGRYVGPAPDYDEEYWGTVLSSTVVGDACVNMDIGRVTPRATELIIKRASNNSVVSPGQTVSPGESVYAVITVVNNDPTRSSVNTLVEFWYRNGTSGTGTKQAMAYTAIAKNGTAYFVLPSFTVSQGDYYCRLKVKCQYNSENFTDTWAWDSTPKFACVPSVVNLPVVSNVIIRDLDGQPVTGITPGKRYVATAEFTDVDGQGDLTTCAIQLRNSADARLIHLGYSLTTSSKSVEDGNGNAKNDSGENMPVQDDYACLTHVEKQSIANGWRIRYIFWLTAKWANCADGIDLRGRAVDASVHVVEGSWVDTNLDFAALSLPSGKWTVIVHGKSNSQNNNFDFGENAVLPFGTGPQTWAASGSTWFDVLSRPLSSARQDEGWAFRMAQKMSLVSRNGAKIHRISDRTLGTLETWIPSSQDAGKYDTFDRSDSTHNILLYEWDDPSDYLELDNPWKDNWYAYGAGDSLYAIWKKNASGANLSVAIGYSRGGVVVSEFSRRLLRAGHPAFQIVYLDAEGWGEFENEVKSFPVSMLDMSFWGVTLGYALGIVNPQDSRRYVTYPGWESFSGNTMSLALGDFVFNSATELSYYKYLHGFGYADYKFTAWKGTRSDQYRQAYSNPNMAFCGAEALTGGGNDRTVEFWPQNSSLRQFIPTKSLEGYESGELSHSHIPHYFIDWLYLSLDTTIASVCVETPQIWKWQDSNGTTQSVSTLSYPSQEVVVPENVDGDVFNSGARDGSAAGWTYHGGFTPFEDRGVDGIEWVDSGYEFQIAPYKGLDALRHNWQVSPTSATGVRFCVEYQDLLFATDDSLSVFWEDNWLGYIYSTDVNNGLEAVTMPFTFPNSVGRLKFEPYFRAFDAEFLLDNVEFVGGSRPIVGSLSGLPTSLVQGANLRLVAGGVFDSDGAIIEVKFYRDSNGNGVYDSSTDELFDVASNYTGAASNWEITRNTTGIPVGQYYFFALAKDTDGLWSAAVRSASQITVTQPANQLPAIGGLSDSPDPVDRGNNVTLTATGVSDADGSVARVEFYHDANNNGVFEAGTDTLLGTDTTIVSGVASVTVSTGTLPAGTRRFFAVAYDNQIAASAGVSCRCAIIQKWELAYQVSPSGAGTIAESPVAGRYANGTQIAPSSSAAANYVFDHWEVNGTTRTMPTALTSDTTVAAVFIYNGGNTVAPVLNAIGNQSVEFGTSFALTVTKQQGDAPIAWMLETAPSGMTINSSGLISWPTPVPAGSAHYITVKASNSAGIDTKSFTLYVTSLGTVAQPQLSLGGGIYPGGSVNVTISCATQGATIRYTTDGNEPTEASSIITSGGVVSVPIPGILKAKAWKTGWIDSQAASAHYSSSDNLISISGTVSYGGTLSGLIHVIAKSSNNETNYSTAIESQGPYVIDSVPSSSEQLNTGNVNGKTLFLGQSFFVWNNQTYDQTLNIRGAIIDAPVDVTIYPGVNYLCYPFPKAVAWENTSLAADSPIGAQMFRWDTNENHSLASHRG